MIGQQQCEGLGALDPVELGEQVDRVGLAAGGDDAAVVALVSAKCILKVSQYTMNCTLMAGTCTATPGY